MFTTNQYSFGAFNLFQGVIVNAGDKNQVENNAASCPWIGFYVYVPTPTDDTTFALMPAQHYTSPSSFAGTTNPVYMVSTHGLKLTESSSTIYRVWRIRNSGSSLEELDLNLPLNSYSTPPKAPQSTGTNNLDEGGVDVKQIAGIGDSLWLTHGLTCGVSGTNQGCIRVMRLDVGQDPGGHVTASVGQSLLFSGAPGTHYWMPAIAANSIQSTVVVFLNSSATTYLSSAFTTKSSTDTAYPAATTLLAGGCTGNSAGRTGDYQGAQTDQNDGTSFWIAGEATPAAGQCNSVWLTQIANVTP
ncbi:MAG TPA: hypothetical protein VHQ90_23220 [Thermoanaerobaculia bacterium]|nr:hypothetical protein [Thermoanaerobaculia bacterium]